jgi:carboxyl-terminal processing protease
LKGRKLILFVLASVLCVWSATETALIPVSARVWPQGPAQGSNGDRVTHSVRLPPSPETSFIAVETRGTLFENVVAILESKYYDKSFRTEVLPKLVSRYSEDAKKARTLERERQVVEQLLSQIPSSHLGLLSKSSHRDIIFDLFGRAYPTFGFQLLQVDRKFYAYEVLEGGPAVRAGVLPWDRVVSIDGISVEKSPRLDWRSDDAHIGDDRDPPVHYLIANRGDSIRVRIQRRRGKFQTLTVAADDYSAMDAAKASARTYEAGGHRLGYLHLWYVHVKDADQLLNEKLEGELSGCDAFIFDLRGRGGSAAMISRIIAILNEYRSTKHRPIIALVDRQSRSAKDVLAYELKRTGLARLVGEPTAGAVIPATFANVGHDSILMFPAFKLPHYTDLLESKPVQPDVFVRRAGPLSAGDDPILRAGIAEAVRLVNASARQGDGRLANR